MAKRQPNTPRRTNENHIAGSTADLEPLTGDEPMAKKKGQRLYPPCNIHVRSVRKRLADADGISAKAAIDGLVHCGILPDDSAKYVEEVSYSQEKTTGEEYTEIEIIWRQ